MEVTVEEIGDLRRKLIITIPSESVKKELEDKYKEIKSQVSIKGFRKGKVPRHILETTYGLQVRGEVGEKLVQDTYFDVLEQERIDAVVHPEVKTTEFNNDGSFTYHAEIDIRPDFALAAYKGLEIEKPDTSATAEEIEKDLLEKQKILAPLRTVTDRPIQEGDIAVIDFQGFDGEIVLPQARRQGYSVEVGSGMIGEEFEQKLVGMQSGEQATHEITFPPDHPHPIFADKTIRFEITVKEIKERILAALDDEFAKDIHEKFQTLDDLKKEIRTQIEEKKEADILGLLSDRIMEKLLASHDFPLPERLVLFELEEIIKEGEKRLKQSGLTLESAGLNRAELEEKQRPLAEKRVRGDFILKKIAAVEGIKIEEQDMEAGFARIAEQYHMSVEEVKRYFSDRDYLLPFMQELLNEKILTFLREASHFTIVPAGENNDTEKQHAGETTKDGAGDSK